MDFRQLEAFCTVVERGSFSQAANHLFLTQPTISNHIHTLENTLNARLLERTTKSVSVTPEGQRFYEYAKSLLRLRDKALREFDPDSQNTISLGASSIPSAYILPDILSAYHRKRQNVSFDVVQSDSQGILERIQNGSLDIGITGTPVTDERLCCRAIYRDEMVLATPHNQHYLALLQQKSPLDMLLQEPYIMREDGSGTRREADQFLETLNLDNNSLHIVARMNDLEAIKQSIIYGLGVSILSATVTKDLLRDNRVLVFPLAQGGVYRNYYLIYRKHIPGNQQLCAFVEFVQQFWMS